MTQGRAPRPGELIQGNKLAKTFAQRLGHRRPGVVPFLAEFYAKEPDICILLAEKYLEFLNDKNSAYPQEYKATNAARHVIQAMREIRYENMDDPSATTSHYESLIGAASLTLVEIVQNGSPK